MGITKRHHPLDNTWTNVYMSSPFTVAMDVWCREHCNDSHYSGHNWNAYKIQDGESKYIVQFVNPKDATAFALKWL